MKVFILVLFIIVFDVQAQAQKFLAVDVYRLGTFKRFCIYRETVIKYKLKGSHRIQRDSLVDMKDSILFLNDGSTIRINEIKFIVVDRSYFWLKLLRRVLTTAGIGFIALDAFNNAINSESPVFKERVLVIGGSLFVAGQLLKATEKKRIRPGRNRRLHVIDPTP